VSQKALLQSLKFFQISFGSICLLFLTLRSVSALAPEAADNLLENLNDVILLRHKRDHDFIGNSEA
jgi:hypothetical protein